MKQIVKRLELIKIAIGIEDEEIIELQVMKLNTLDCDGEVKHILTLVENKDYQRVLLEIDAYLTKFAELTIYEDIELQNLQQELKALEDKLQNFSTLKDEYLNDYEMCFSIWDLYNGKI